MEHINAIYPPEHTTNAHTKLELERDQIIPAAAPYAGAEDVQLYAAFGPWSLQLGADIHERFNDDRTALYFV